MERQHRTVAEGMRSIFLGANLDVKFWPYAFKHYVRIRNVGNMLACVILQVPRDSGENLTPFTKMISAARAI